MDMNELRSSTMPQYPFGTLGKEVREAIEDNFDIKIIITSHNSKTGLGKTTLATIMARLWDQDGWNAEDKAFMNAYRFHEAYKDMPEGSVLLFDEVENEADTRRAMSTKNVELTQMLATDRFRNIVSIYTLPSVGMLDNRMMELSDYWINVMRRGVAHPYRIYVNDFDGSVIRKWIGQPEPGEQGEVLTWDDVPDDDPDKATLDEMKRENSDLDREYVEKGQVDEMIEQEVDERLREYRDEVIRSIYHHEDTSLSQAAIADMSWVDVQQPTVQKILSNGE